LVRNLRYSASKTVAVYEGRATETSHMAIMLVNCILQTGTLAKVACSPVGCQHTESRHFTLFDAYVS